MATEVRIPDIGDFEEVEVIEVLVQEGDQVQQEAPLITLESDKAAMDIPAPQAGTVEKLHLKPGDKVSEGALILTLATAGAAQPQADKEQDEAAGKEQAAASPPASAEPKPSPSNTADQPTPTPPPPATPPAPPAASGQKPYASPTVRRLARELGANLALISGTGPKQRITKDDVKQFIRNALRGGVATEGAAKQPPAVELDTDFARYGATETEQRSRVATLTARNMQHSWSTIPHVTQFNEADITELEAFRKSQQEEAQSRGVKLTLISFLLKAIAGALQEFPLFNSSLGTDGKSLIRKQYYHIGMAVNGPAGLVVPVLRDVNQKGVYQIAHEVQDMVKLARARRLKPDQMKGGCFTLSSLGGMGGLQFTPIVNPPEVAILGVSHSVMRPAYDKQKHSFEPRLMLPLALSYDHRVINGVDGAMFNKYLSELLGDVPRLML